MVSGIANVGVSLTAPLITFDQFWGVFPNLRLLYFQRSCFVSICRNVAQREQ